jgi:hypothetical protein
LLDKQGRRGSQSAFGIILTSAPIIKILFLRGYFHTFPFDIEPDSCKQVHVQIRNPNERETADEISSPIVKQKLVMGKKKESHGCVVAQTIFACENVEKFSLVQTPTLITLAFTPGSRLFE